MILNRFYLIILAVGLGAIQKVAVATDLPMQANIKDPAESRYYEELSSENQDQYRHYFSQMNGASIRGAIDAISDLRAQMATPKALPLDINSDGFLGFEDLRPSLVPYFNWYSTLHYLFTLQEELTRRDSPLQSENLLSFLSKGPKNSRFDFGLTKNIFEDAEEGEPLKTEGSFKSPTGNTPTSNTPSRERLRTDFTTDQVVHTTLDSASLAWLLEIFSATQKMAIERARQQGLSNSDKTTLATWRIQTCQAVNRLRNFFEWDLLAPPPEVVATESGLRAIYQYVFLMGGKTLQERILPTIAGPHEWQKTVLEDGSSFKQWIQDLVSTRDKLTTAVATFSTSKELAADFLEKSGFVVAQLASAKEDLGNKIADLNQRRENLTWFRTFDIASEHCEGTSGALDVLASLPLGDSFNLANPFGNKFVSTEAAIGPSFQWLSAGFDLIPYTLLVNNPIQANAQHIQSLENFVGTFERTLKSNNVISDSAAGVLIPRNTAADTSESLILNRIRDLNFFTDTPPVCDYQQSFSCAVGLGVSDVTADETNPSALDHILREELKRALGLKPGRDSDYALGQLILRKNASDPNFPWFKPQEEQIVAVSRMLFLLNSSDATEVEQAFGRETYVGQATQIVEAMQRGANYDKMFRDFLSAQAFFRVMWPYIDQLKNADANLIHQLLNKGGLGQLKLEGGTK